MVSSCETAGDQRLVTEGLSALLDLIASPLGRLVRIALRYDLGALIGILSARPDRGSLQSPSYILAMMIEVEKRGHQHLPHRHPPQDRMWEAIAVQILLPPRLYGVFQAENRALTLPDDSALASIRFDRNRSARRCIAASRRPSRKTVAIGRS
jgi:hypothetical protein